LNGKTMPLPSLLAKLNADYRHAPWAWDLVLENRFTGVKSRGVYINPAATLLQCGINALARAILNKACFDLYTRLGVEYGAMLYRGEYFSAQRVALEAAAHTILADLSGKVTLRTAQTVYAARIDAPGAIFSRAGATFEASDFSHQDAEGFARLSWHSSIGRHAVAGVKHADTLETTGPAAPSV
jgi:argininosuccinate synthase